MKKETILQHTMNWGAIAGVSLVLFNLLLYFSNLMENKFVGILNWGILITITVLAARKYRDDIQDGSMSYGKALKITVLTSLFASMILGLYMFIFYKFIDPTAIQRALDMIEQAMLQDNKIPEEQIEMMMEMNYKVMTPPILAISTIFSYVFIMTIVGLITSIFLKRSADPFQNPQGNGMNNITKF